MNCDKDGEEAKAGWARELRGRGGERNYTKREHNFNLDLGREHSALCMCVNRILLFSSSVSRTTAVKIDLSAVKNIIFYFKPKETQPS